MHLRKVTKSNGRVYLAIGESFRVDGKTKTRHVETIGYVDELISDECPDPVAWWKEEITRRNEQAKEVTSPLIIKFYPSKKIDKHSCGQIDLGSAIPSKYFHCDLGIGSFFERKRTARKFAYDPCRILELLTWNRISKPTSKRKAWEGRLRFGRKCEFSLDDMYRCLDYLNTNADGLVKHMNASLEDARGPRNKTRLYYDVTNYYFEVEEEDGFRMRGVCKENKPNPIVQMGLLLDGDGIPLDYELFSGNTNDMLTMLPVMKKASLRRKGSSEDSRIIMVADKGLNTSANIAACTLDNNGFILSQSVRKAPKTLKDWVLDDKDYEKSRSGSFKIKSRMAEKAVYVVGDDGRRKKVMIDVKEVAFWSRDYCERSGHERQKVVEKSLAALKRGDASSMAARNSVRYAKDKPVVRATGEVADHNWVLDKGKIAADAELDGYYCIITSELHMDDHEIIDAYRGLWRIEESFRVLKSDFSARPVYVSREEHIRAHFLICYVALMIMRLIQVDTNQKYSACTIAEAL
ncbi:MAG: IS1634 family transposase, partial [Raoultibacter sp.]